jgi:hypothetical protein
MPTVVCTINIVKIVNYFDRGVSYGAVVKRRQEKGRWTKGRRGHKVDRAIIRQKVNDKRWTGLATMTKGR